MVIPMGSLCTRNAFSVESMRLLDELAAHALEISSYQLMERAGVAALEVLKVNWPDARKLLVFCGTGNNGGDGWIVARCAIEQGLDCEVFLLGSADKISGPALSAFESWQDVSGQIPRDAAEFSGRTSAKECPREVIVDALVGIGLRANQRPDLTSLIEQLNRDPAPIFALDCPSGLHAGTGARAQATIEATATVTFIAHKPGLLTGAAVDSVGTLELATLGVPQSVLAAIAPSARLLRSEDMKSVGLKRRQPASHKGHFGRILVLGGNLGMGGAAILSAQGALRAGAGLVTLATRDAHVSAVLARQPEVMVRGVGRTADLKEAVRSADVIVVGPGLGQDEWATMCLGAALDSDAMLVCDADALTLISGMDWHIHARPVVLTPHPGEAARLLRCSVRDIEQDRLSAVKTLAQTFSATVVLKGAGSLIASSDPDRPPEICLAGNPGMATGGMGDVLAGVIAGLLGQNVAADNAAVLGVLVHACAADQAYGQQGVGLLPSDVLALIGGALTQD